MPDTHDDVDSMFHELVERISVRLRPICSHMPESEFRALIEQMARVEHKYIHHPRIVPAQLQDGAGWPHEQKVRET